MNLQYFRWKNDNLRGGSRCAHSFLVCILDLDGNPPDFLTHKGRYFSQTNNSMIEPSGSQTYICRTPSPRGRGPPTILTWGAGKCRRTSSRLATSKAICAP